ncbi:hypothetical protein BMF89_16725 [Arthrobacter sp. SRS-W-1-2016]|uniref:DUF4192 domain-containing protein n=1 Tax=Arthrobacter sp. SRS-W-1-2016 TaxID=1930254 RepID=UPI000990BFB4|nr:DUF4192 domain-containing protein [Arthrobacter sp. SRS-W-1-2016]OOP60382.1 hypothetical protein BMF89_16725 [Arthrobacter sp. SRS-W-1-2016]
MDTLTIKTPADVLSFIGHTLGFWPHESLVCITLDSNHIGATLRVDLPKHDGGELAYAQTVAGYLGNDTNATSALFAVYTSAEPTAGHNKPYAAVIAALTGALAERHITIRDGLLVGDQTVSPYDDEPGLGRALPLSMIDTSEINAELVYRGSAVARTGRIVLPASNKEATFDAVETHIESIGRCHDHSAIEKARTLWAGILDARTYPSDDQVIALIANFQFAAIRDQLMADIPAVDGPMEQILLAQTPGKPQWDRVEWAQQILLHAYTHSSTKHSAPLLTAVGYINWWEGRGSKAHQFLELALEADPGYRLAKLSDQLLSYGMLAGWNMDKDTAYRTRGLGTSD